MLQNLDNFQTNDRIDKSVISSCRLTAQRCLDHPWLRNGSLIDRNPSFLPCNDDSATLSCNSTIVPDDDDFGDDQTDVGSVFQDTLDETVVDCSSNQAVPTVGSPHDSVPLTCAATTAAATTTTAASTKLVALPQWNDNKPMLSAVLEDASFNSYVISRRGNSLPFRFRAPTSRRETSCDRASDLGYGSDGISEISSADSSSDRSSIISLDDTPSEWTQPNMRRYSDTSLARRTWERFLPATPGACDGVPLHLFRQEGDRNPIANSPGVYCRPWERICTGSRARALERFNASPPSNVTPSPELSKSYHSLTSQLIRPAVKVPEVRTRLLNGPTTVAKTPPMPIKASLIHLEKGETVRSRVVKFQSVAYSPTTTTATSS